MRIPDISVDARVELRATDGTTVVGHYTSLKEAKDAARKACGDPNAEGESVSGPLCKMLMYSGPLGSAYVGW